LTGPADLPTCERCIAVMHDENWKPCTRGGKEIPRAKGSKTPCWKCPKIPKGMEPRPENAVELTARGWAAWWYWLQCKEDQTCQLPRDRITLRNAALLRQVEQQALRSQTASDTADLVLALLAARKR
jgi:hypothetical protein